MMIIGIKTLYWKNQSFGGITVACVGSHRLPVATDIQKSSAKNSFLCCNWLADFYENWHECSLSQCQQLDESWFLKLRSRSSDIKAQIFKIEAISLKISMKFLRQLVWPWFNNFMSSSYQGQGHMISKVKSLNVIFLVM